MSDLNATEWDEFVTAHPNGHVLQTSAWADLKIEFGWRAARVVARKDGKIMGGAQVLFRPMPLDMGALAYIPKGPLTDWDNSELTDYVFQICHDIARRGNAWLLKAEPDLPDTPAAAAQLEARGFVPSQHSIQPRRSLALDLTRSEDELLAAMKQKTRYNVRLAAKKGVTVRTANPDEASEELARFNQLMRLTAQRSAFGVHDPRYYTTAYRLFQPKGQVELFFAEHDGQPLAAVMVFAVAGRAWYLYGASNNEARERMPTYAVQWAAIRWAKAQGCHSYDFYGVPDVDLNKLEAEFIDRTDGLWPVYRFKRGWGGTLNRSIGTWDYAYSRLGYKLYQTMVKRRNRAQAAQ